MSVSGASRVLEKLPHPVKCRKCDVECQDGSDDLKSYALLDSDVYDDQNQQGDDASDEREEP